MELSVVMPCLNEAETVGTCVSKTLAFFEASGIDGEVVIADNGSTDGSQDLAAAAGARVVLVAEKGYGNALMGGIRAARAPYVAMGDCDDSYDFATLGPFLDDLRDGAQLVMGNRFQGGIAPGAMPRLHRYLGNPVLSFLGRLFFGSKIGDFHCGLRAFDRQAILDLDLHTGGMEFASEMVVRSTLEGYDIRERPTTLAPDGRSRPPHLNTWRDGWRHLRFLVLYSPRWLFTVPGAALMLLGLVLGVALEIGPVTVGNVGLDVNSLVLASAMITIGFQSLTLGVLTKLYAVSEGFLPSDPFLVRQRRFWSLEKGLVIGGVLAVLGLAGLVGSLAYWNGESFGQLDPRESLRIVVPSATALIMSMQVVFTALFASILLIRRRPESSPAAVVDRPAAPQRAVADRP